MFSSLFKKKRPATEQTPSKKKKTKRGSGPSVGRAKKQNLEERNIIRAFLEEKSRRHETITNDDILELAHSLGRKRELIMVWLNRAKQQGSEIRPQLLSDKFTIRGTKKNCIKGCGISCQRDEGDYEVVCPKCKKFKFHSSCLTKRLQKMGVHTPKSYVHENWCCPHCLRREDISIVHTFI